MAVMEAAAMEAVIGMGVMGWHGGHGGWGGYRNGGWDGWYGGGWGWLRFRILPLRLRRGLLLQFLSNIILMTTILIHTTTLIPMTIVITTITRKVKGCSKKSILLKK